MKIADTTTLSELASARSLLGIDIITLQRGQTDRRRHAFVYVGGTQYLGAGDTEAEALNEAFAKILGSR